MFFREFVDPVHEKVDVLTFSVASKVILDKGRAKGIEVKRFGKTLEYFACNEVILSAGALGSPQELNPIYISCELTNLCFKSRLMFETPCKSLLDCL